MIFSTCITLFISPFLSQNCQSLITFLFFKGTISRKIKVIIVTSLKNTHISKIVTRISQFKRRIFLLTVTFCSEWQDLYLWPDFSICDVRYSKVTWRQFFFSEFCIKNYFFLSLALRNYAIMQYVEGKIKQRIFMILKIALVKNFHLSIDPFCTFFGWSVS